MEQERIFRHSLPGIFFLLSAIVFYSLLGGDLFFLTDVFNDAGIATLIALVITAPSLGYLVSSISVSLVHLFQGYNFFVKEQREDVKKVIFPVLPEANISKYKYYIKYQSYARIHAKDETIRFLQRRWNFLWINVNSIAGVLLGAAFGIFCKIMAKKPAIVVVKTQNEFKHLTWIVLAFLILFVIASYFQIRFLRREILDIEDESIIEIDRFEKDNRSKQPSIY